MNNIDFIDSKIPEAIKIADSLHSKEEYEERKNPHPDDPNNTYKHYFCPSFHFYQLKVKSHRSFVAEKENQQSSFLA